MAVLQGITIYLQNFFSNLGVAIKQDSKGWTICLCVLILTILRSGITYSFGEFVVELEATYHRPLAEQNWIGTLSFCISLSCAPVSVAFIRALKYRGYRWGGIIGTIILGTSCMASSFVGTMEWLFLTHSLLYGVGSSLVYMASSLVIGEYFDDNHKYHVLATSILLCGYPIGSLLFNPINAWLVTRFTWRIAFRFSSILILGLGIGCCWTFSSKDEPGHQQFQNEDEDNPKTPESEKNYLSKIPRKCCTLQEVKDRPEIILWYVANMISYLGFFMPFLNLAYYMELKGIPPEKSSFALTLLSFMECVTYIIASFVGDWFKGKLIMTNVIASGALAFICLFWPVVDINYGIILLISLCMGGFLGLTIVYTYACSGEVTGLPIDIAWSYTNLWSGIGILMGPFFSGAIYDLRKSYDDVFYVVGCLYLVDAMLFASIVYLQRRRAAFGGSIHPDYNEIAGVVGNTHTTQTFKITGNRSFSKGSLGDLANGEAGEGHVTGSGRGELAPISPDPYAHVQQGIGGGYGSGGGGGNFGGGGGVGGGGGYNSFKPGEPKHPLAPSFQSSQNYNSLQ